MPPEREDLQRRREAFQQFLAKLSAEQEEASADTPPGEPQRAHGEGLPPQPPQHQADQQQRQLEAIQRYMSDQDAQRDATDAKRGESPATNHPPSHPRRMSWGRVLLALAAGTAILLPGILIARALRSNTPTCPTSTTSADGTGGSGGATPTAVVVGDSMSTMTAPAGPQIAFPLVTARLLGWHVTVDAHPDTGFATPDGHDPQHPNFAATVGCVVPPPIHRSSSSRSAPTTQQRAAQHRSSGRRRQQGSQRYTGACHGRSWSWSARSRLAARHRQGRRQPATPSGQPPKQPTRRLSIPLRRGGSLASEPTQPPATPTARSAPTGGT